MTAPTIADCDRRIAELEAQLKLWKRRRNKLRMVILWADPGRRKQASERAKGWVEKRNYQKLPQMDQKTYWQWRKLRAGGAHSREEALRILALDQLRPLDFSADAHTLRAAAHGGTAPNGTAAASPVVSRGDGARTSPGRT